MTDARIVLQAHEARCGYHGREVLHGVSLTARAGTITGILGPNGCGKTTLLHALTGIRPLASGEVRLRGEPLAAYTDKARARLTGVVEQAGRAPLPFRCLSVTLMGRHPRLNFLGGYGPQDMDAAVSAMRATGTFDLAECTLDTVSGGEAARVLLARALAQTAPTPGEPEGVLLLDEATAAMDIAWKIKTLDLLRCRARQGATILTVMHDVNLAALYCDRLLFLKDGRAVAEGETAAIFRADVFSEVYGTDVCIAPHPVTGAPQAHLVPGDLPAF